MKKIELDILDEPIFRKKYWISTTLLKSKKTLIFSDGKSSTMLMKSKNNLDYK